MKCPKCNSQVRPSKKHPGYYLCDNCRKRYSADSVIKDSRKKSTSRRKRKKRPALILFILFLIAAGVISVLLFSKFFSQDKNRQPQKETIEAYSVSDTAVIDNTELRVISFETSSGNSLVQPSPGNVFLLVNLELKNTSDSDLTVSSVSNFNLIVNEEKHSHKSSAYDLLTEAQPRLDGCIKSGETLNGWLCFEVPADCKDVQIQYVNPVWSLHKLQYNLSLSQ